MINIEGINKAKLLAALFNYAKPQGLGLLHYDAKDMTEQDAQALLDRSSDMSFDYLQGRSVKVDIGGDMFDPWLYDRDNGPGAAEKVIETLR